MSPTDMAAEPEPDLFADLLDWIADEATAPTVAAAEADEAAAALAAALAALTAAARRGLWHGPWPAEGLAAVLERMAPAARAVAATELAGSDANRLAALCDAVLRRAVAGAPDAAAVLAPDATASLLLLSWQAGGAGAAFAARLRAAAERGKAEAALAAAVVPSCVSRPVALLHAAVAPRFGAPDALALVRGQLVQRLLAPALDGVAAAALDRFAADVVAAGMQAEAFAAEGDDPDDLLVQRGAALASGLDLFAAFAEPTPPDPLGTLPAVKLTALGQAILAARQQRPTYDWATVQQAAEADPDGFTILLGDERAAVLDLALAASGIAPERLPG